MELMACITIRWQVKFVFFGEVVGLGAGINCKTISRTGHRFEIKDNDCSSLCLISLAQPSLPSTSLVRALVPVSVFSLRSLGLFTSAPVAMNRRKGYISVSSVWRGKKRELVRQEWGRRDSDLILHKKSRLERDRRMLNIVRVSF